MSDLTAFAVGEPFPIPGMIPPREGAILELTSAGPMVVIQMPGLRREERRGFKKGFKRYSYLESFPVACWIFDFAAPFNVVDTSFNGRLVDPEWIDDYLDDSEGVKNALDFLLLDGEILRGIKRVGLQPDAVKLFHNTIRKQMAADYTPAEYDGALGNLFQKQTDELFKMGQVFKK
jgi:hypothetical protein